MRARAFCGISALSYVTAQVAAVCRLWAGVGRGDGLSRGGCRQERLEPLISDESVMGGVMGTLPELGAFLFGVPIPSMATVTWGSLKLQLVTG